MPSFDRGTKRQCQSCEVKFYDLNRDPIICPGCGEKFVIVTAAAPKVKEEKPAPEEKTTDKSSAEAEPDVISLDEAEDEENAAEEIPDIDDVEVDDNVNADQQDTFLEEEDEDGSKVDLGVSSDTSEEQ